MSISAQSTLSPCTGGFGSITRTSYPAPSNASTTWEPTKPEPPVTAIMSSITRQLREQGLDDVIGVILIQGWIQRQAYVARAEQFGAGQRSIGVRRKHWLLMQRGV